MKNDEELSRNLEINEDTPKNHKRKVQWDEKQLKENKLLKSLTEKSIEDLIKGNELKLLDEICILKIKNSEAFLNISKNHEINSSSLEQLIREDKSNMLSSFNGAAFITACITGNMEAIDYLTQNFTKSDLHKNICSNEYKGFDTYLIRCRRDLDKGQYKSDNFIKMMKLFLAVAETNKEALDHYIKSIQSDYDAKDIMRKDFISALIESKASGIVKEINIDEIATYYNLAKSEKNEENFSFVQKLEKEQNISKLSEGLGL